MPKILLLIYVLLTTLLRMPLAFLFIILRGLGDFIPRRLEFERKNLVSKSACSFKKINKKAAVMFHLSSEGEFEQVKELIEAYLSHQLKVEIVYTSPSVEKKCEKFYEESLENKENLRFFRLPLLSFWPFSFLYFQSLWSFVTAPTVIMCRYDFYPELLAFALFGKRMVLVSATSKKVTFYKKFCYQFFHEIVVSSAKDLPFFKKNLPLGRQLSAFDLRIPRVLERHQTRDLKLGHGIFLQELKKEYPEKKMRFILGSAWEEDLDLFYDQELMADLKAQKLVIVILPHQLKSDSLFRMEKKLQQILGSELLEIIEDQSQPYLHHGVVLVKIPGILCEMYGDFEVAYIGGGFGHSVHSVLEPYLSEAKVITGPKVQRSTEYDQIIAWESEAILSVDHPGDIYRAFKKLILYKREIGVYESIVQFSRTEKARLLSHFLKDHL